MKIIEAILAVSLIIAVVWLVLWAIGHSPERIASDERMDVLERQIERCKINRNMFWLIEEEFDELAKFKKRDKCRQKRLYAVFRSKFKDVMYVWIYDKIN